ncbi:MAG: lipid-A-disaccharide synthase N-terminal domain-containing protein [Rhodanobacteraceae bacterium]
MSGTYWLALGLVGQTIFSARFVLQWLYSEHKRQSAIPMAFWYASIIGGAILLGYAIHIRDPVFITGQAGGVLIYLRNLQLRLRETKVRKNGSPH